jgi:DNA-binding MarR family transcriptional regulator
MLVYGRHDVEPRMTNPAPKPDLCNCFAIRKAARHVTQHYDRTLAPSGLRTTQYAILQRIARSGHRTINELAAEMALDRTTMGRNLRPLERDGLVVLTPDPEDRRRRALTLTESGRERLAAARALWVDAQASFEAAYGSAPAKALRETLSGLVAVDLGTD